MKRRRICLRTTAGGGSGWSSLPGDLLQQISGYLSTDADHLHIHQVCAPWRACTSAPTAFRPWILARSRSPAPSSCNYYSLWLPRRHLQRQVDIVAPPAGLPYCCGASRGWLALTDNALSPTRLVLWDPSSGAEVPLPPLPGVNQVFLSADPLASPDWTAVASQRHGNTGAQRSSFCRPGDAAWSALCDRPTAGVVSVAFHAGRIHLLDWQHVLVVCDLLNLGAPVQMRNISGHISRFCTCDGYPCIRGAHMVSCAGDLLLVVLCTGGHPSLVEIYKLEPPPERGWPLELGERVTDLGSHSLFLGCGEGLALSAEEFPAVRRNRVYGLGFDGNYCSRSYGHDWAFVFDLGEDTLEKIPYPGEFFRDGGGSNFPWQPLFWLCPRGGPFVKKRHG